MRKAQSQHIEIKNLQKLLMETHNNRDLWNPFDSADIYIIAKTF